MDLHRAVEHTAEQHTLSRAETRAAVLSMLSGSADPADIARLLSTLAARGETVDEIAGAADALTESMVVFEHDHSDAIDTCGTGGDGLSSFNISTAAAIVAASAGARVIKHGNRSQSSSTGSADLLEAAGLPLDLSSDRSREILDRVGITFLFAPLYHPALRHAAPVRRALRVRTLFNYVGPMVNPGRVRRQLMGVSESKRVDELARVLSDLERTSAYVVHGAGGADELTLCGENRVRAVGSAPALCFDAAAVGLDAAPIESLRGGDARENLRILQALLDGERTSIRDAVLLNSAAALVVAGLAETASEGIARARESIDSGAARALHALDRCGARKLEAVMSGTRLDPIVRDVKRRSAERRAKLPLSELRRSVRADDSRRRRFLSALSAALSPALSIGELAVIAELKRRSPSAGALHASANIDLVSAPEGGRSAWSALAGAYARGGASALSVLTEEDHFAGCLADLESVAFTGLPRLRKDFILDEGMLFESAHYGADAVLLLPVILDDSELTDLHATARELGLAALVEVHDERELERALALAPEPQIVGVNARDLCTFEVDIANIEHMLPRIPNTCIKVAESGMRTLADLKRVRAAGANAALIGEALVRSGDPERTLRAWKDGLRD